MKKKLFFSFLIAGLALMLIIFTMAVTKRTYKHVAYESKQGKVRYTLEKLRGINSHNITLSADVKVLEIDLRRALITKVRATNVNIIPTTGEEANGLRITIFAVYYNAESKSFDVLDKHIFTRKYLEECILKGCDGNDLAKDDSTRIFLFKVRLYAGDDHFLGSKSTVMGRYYVYGTSGDKCFIGGPKADYFESEEGNDIFWLKGSAFDDWEEDGGDNYVNPY